jgi:hypothetical protein
MAWGNRCRVAQAHLLAPGCSTRISPSPSREPCQILCCHCFPLASPPLQPLVPLLPRQCRIVVAQISRFNSPLAKIPGRQRKWRAVVSYGSTEFCYDSRGGQRNKCWGERDSLRAQQNCARKIGFPRTEGRRNGVVK